MADTIGYAVKTRAGDIDVRTVSITILTARANGLILAGYQLIDEATDEQIDAAWARLAQSQGLTVVMIDIRERKHHDA